MSINRRKFIQTTTTALMLSSLDAFATKHPSAYKLNSAFELKILATNWGFPGTLDTYCAKVKAEGYNGIEIWWPMKKAEQEELFTLLKKYNLEVGFLCGANQSDWRENLDYFKTMIDAAAGNTAIKPLYINCHSGKDYFSFDENKAFIDYTVALSKKTGIRICHETHRSRILFAAPIAKQYIEKNPELRITLDVSHWCNVSESLLKDQQTTMDLVLSRVDHVHARIGHAQGPQVNDPRAPEWVEAVEAHFAWWDKIMQLKKTKGETLTILTEFGPPNYMPTMPYTQQPIVDQWAINVHMLHLLRKRYT
jgi:sugar phosphate isomerase/epimerase